MLSGWYSSALETFVIIALYKLTFTIPYHTISNIKYQILEKNYKPDLYELTGRSISSEWTKSRQPESRGPLVPGQKNNIIFLF